MEGFEVFIFIALGAALLMVIASVVLEKSVPEKKKQYLRFVFLGLLIISLGIFIFSFIIGGWEGIGFGFMAISILAGTLLGGLINVVTDAFRRSENKQE
ncbi:hypothetical protein AV656_09840 [Bhargavaea cecembensis]|uniref:YesK-like protein n=1 Tax=Bhargavaea cecembensis TaxID=394098 RepID=A0A161RI90_9BACL|nr:YesK family protein [Bhargavaea cecembensis]KZE37818.1 hypothetical protein AV656_09840 [Bhargavaea cecembensis]